LRILILGGSSKIARSLALSFQDNSYEIELYERRKENMYLDEWILHFASLGCTIINCIRGKDLQPDKKIHDALVTLKFRVNFIHLSSRIVVSKSAPFARKDIKECESEYTRLKLGQEFLYEHITHKNALVRTSILRLGYFCETLSKIDHRLFIVMGVSKKPRKSVLEYITAKYLAENILKRSEGITDLFEDSIAIEKILNDKRVWFVPSVGYTLLCQCVSLVRAHRLRNKIEEMVYDGRN
jgi:tRNA splicing endonuclease